MGGAKWRRWWRRWRRLLSIAAVAAVVVGAGRRLGRPKPAPAEAGAPISSSPGWQAAGRRRGGCAVPPYGKTVPDECGDLGFPRSGTVEGGAMADEGRGPQRPAGWKKDPSGRHYGRYWDGFEWTDHVISAEKVQSVDLVHQQGIGAQPAAEEPVRERVVESTEPAHTIRPAAGYRMPSARSRRPRALPLLALTAGIIGGLVLIGVAVGRDDNAPAPTASQSSQDAAATTAAATKCEPAGNQQLSIIEGLKGGASSLRKATAVALNPPVGTFRFVVVAEIDGGGALAGDGQVGAWGTSGPSAGGLIFALDATAQRYSQWGEDATEGSPADLLRDEAASRPEVAEARACLVR